MNLRRFWAVARKEFLHIRRDPRSLVLAIGIPMLMILIFGYALTLDVNHVPVVVWDQGRSVESREYVARFSASRYFDLVRTVGSYSEITDVIDRREALLALVIPATFAGDLAAGRGTEVQALVDGSDSNTAAIVLGYTQAVTQGFNDTVSVTRLQQAGLTSTAPLELRPRVWFNADLESKNFIIPGLIAVILGLIAALLTSLTIAREWERGSMEQLISTPVRPVELVLGKLTPYFVIGMVDVLIAIGLAVFLFQVPLRGSVVLLLAMAGIFIVGTLSQGILISILTRQQLLASQLAMVSTFLPAFLLSGFMFAIPNMPWVVQGITHIVPARYFVALVKGIYLRGVGLDVMWRDALLLSLFSLGVAGASVLRFKKTLG